MSSASVIYSFGCFPNILDIAYITHQNIYYICGFAMKVSSYRTLMARVVGLIGIIWEMFIWGQVRHLDCKQG